MNLKEFLTGYRGKEIPKELTEFNWGAFLLTFIWGIRFRAWVTLLAIPFIWIQMPLGLNWLLFIILQFYCGFNGNKWAYQIEYWKKPADFRRTQAKWAIGAVAVNIIIPLAVISFIIRFINKSPDNFTELAKNAQCSISYKELKKEFPKITFNPAASSYDIAQLFAARYNLKPEGSSVKVKIKDVDFDITFTKYDENACDLSSKNCIVKSAYNLPIGSIGFQACTFYFDRHKKIVPEPQTQKAIDKGLNIFKYL